MKTNTEILEGLKSNLTIVTAHLEMLSTGTTIQRCNTIFQVGGYTVTTDNDRKVGIEITMTPMQFEASTAKELTKVFKNVHGEYIQPVAYTVKGWYEAKAKELTESVELFEKVIKIQP